MKNKIVIAVTGASGSIYARVLLEKIISLAKQVDEIGLVASDNARQVWKHELKTEFNPDLFKPVKYYEKYDFSAPFASGSTQYNTMIICPCSMGTLGRIASGISDDLITRAADVMLKERRRLILVTRDSPLSLIHINNMKFITEAGGIICPASPSFYSQPQDFNQLAVTVVDRVLDLAGLDHPAFRWNENQ